MKIASFTKKGIVVDTNQLHQIGPVEGAFRMLGDLMSSTDYYTVKFDADTRQTHLLVDSSKGKSVSCGYEPNGDYTIWNVEKKEITCMKCIEKFHRIETN